MGSGVGAAPAFGSLSAGGAPDGRRYLVLASDEEGQVSNGMVAYVCRYYLFAPDVTVVSRLSAAAGQYDRLLVLDAPAGGLPPGLYDLG